MKILKFSTTTTKQQQQIITTNDIFILTFKWMEKVFSFLVFRQLE